MKKVIFGAFLVASVGALSSFTTGNTIAKNDTVASRSNLGTADSRSNLGTADSRSNLGTADSRSNLGTADVKKAANHANDQTILGTAD